MLTHSFYNLAPKKFKPKTMHIKTKAFTEKLPCSSVSRIQFSSKEVPHTESLVCKNFSAKKLYTGEIMSVSAVPNAESNKDLVVEIPSQIYDQNNLNFDPSIIIL